MKGLMAFIYMFLSGTKYFCEEFLRKINKITNENYDYELRSGVVFVFVLVKNEGLCWFFKKKSLLGSNLVARPGQPFQAYTVVLYVGVRLEKALFEENQSLRLD